MANLLGKLGMPSFGNLSSEHRAGLLGVGWTTLGQIAGLSIRFVSLILLYRFLGPKDFGFATAALAVLMVVEFLSDIGLRPAIVRHPDGERSEFISTAWLMMIGRGFLLSAVTLTAGFVLPRFWPQFDPVLLVWVIAVLSLRPILHSFSNPMAMLLHKHMRFDRWSLLEFSQTFVGSTVSIVCAYFLRNVWALVIGTLAGELAFVVMTYVVCKRPPRPSWHAEVARELSHFGNQVFFNTMVMGLWLYIDRLVGPVFLGPGPMGLYATAWNLMDVIERLALKACDVYYSTLTRIKDGEEQLRFHRSICRRVALFLMPPLAIGVILAPWSVKILFKPEFRGAGILFAILMCRVMVRILGQIQFQILLARGEIYVATRCYIIAFFVQLAAIVPLAQWFGVVGVAYSVLISTFVLTLSQNLFLSRRKELGLESFVITYIYMAIGLIVVQLI